MHTLIAPLVNLSVLLAVLVYCLKTPLTNYVQGRHETIKTDLNKVRTLLNTAREKYEEFNAKLKAIDVEVATIQTQVRQEGEGTRTRILNHAKSSAASILAEAKTRAESMVEDGKVSLRVELGGRIIARAEQLIQDRLTGDDHARLRREFSERVGAIQ